MLEARLSQKNRCAAGKREYVQVLRLIENRPARLDLACYPHLAMTAVATTSASSYMSLLSGETP